MRMPPVSQEDTSYFEEKRQHWRRSEHDMSLGKGRDSNSLEEEKQHERRSGLSISSASSQDSNHLEEERQHWRRSERAKSWENCKDFSCLEEEKQHWRRSGRTSPPNDKKVSSSPVKEEENFNLFKGLFGREGIFYRIQERIGRQEKIKNLGRKAEKKSERMSHKSVSKEENGSKSSARNKVINFLINIFGGSAIITLSINAISNYISAQGYYNDLLHEYIQSMEVFLIKDQLGSVYQDMEALRREITNGNIDKNKRIEYEKKKIAFENLSNLTRSTTEITLRSLSQNDGLLFIPWSKICLPPELTKLFKSQWEDPWKHGLCLPLDTYIPLTRNNPERRELLLNFLKQSGLGFKDFKNNLPNPPFDSFLKGINLGEVRKGNYAYSLDLKEINLSKAIIPEAKFSRANLRDANFQFAKMQNSYLVYANLESAKLLGANLNGANLTGANLRGANLTDANLEGATNPNLRPGQGIVICRTTMPDGRQESRNCPLPPLLFNF